MANPDSKSQTDKYLKGRAWARQMLGLSLTEFNALTPHEISIELSVARDILQRKLDREELLLQLIDQHMSSLETIIYNSNYKNSSKISDFRLLKDVDEKKVSKEVLAFDAHIRAQVCEKLRKEGRLK